jgi:hypothetical protein
MPESSLGYGMVRIGMVLYAMGFADEFSALRAQIYEIILEICTFKE